MLGQMIKEHTRFAGTLMHREIDPEVGTLEDPNEGNGRLIFLGIVRNVSDNLIGTMEHECGLTSIKNKYEILMPYENDFVHVM